MFDYLLVYVAETRKNLGPDETIYQLDANYTENYGRRPLGDAELEINITMQVLQQLQQEFPELIGSLSIAS